ncbi:hypothetical protein HQ544_04100 [Candidatus Falkowbacteria bacterium]|nr:hypothetical protein [Candidatus Falkowbacteria bacterium]
MITLSNGHQMDFLVSSGALAYSGYGWPWDWPLVWSGVIKPEEFTIDTKSFTRYYREGNYRWYRPWSVLRPLAGGCWVNSFGLSNPGLAWGLRKFNPYPWEDLNIILSIFPTSPEECSEMCQMAEGAKIVGIEVDVSCPNVDSTRGVVSICRAAKESTSIPLIAKFGYQHPTWLIREVAPYFQALHLINAVLWATVFPHKKSPLARYGGGGVSGPIIQPFCEDKLKELAGVGVPIIAGGGIDSIEVVKRYAELGASAFSFGTLFLNRPWEPNRIARKWRQNSLSL